MRTSQYEEKRLQEEKLARDEAAAAAESQEIWLISENLADLDSDKQDAREDLANIADLDSDKQDAREYEEKRLQEEKLARDEAAAAAESQEIWLISKNLADLDSDKQDAREYEEKRLQEEKLARDEAAAATEDQEIWIPQADHPFELDAREYEGRSLEREEAVNM
ncbi:hypothetical protein ADUPG1_012062 [Aduncisulcus paluster]|uniref:Uncharacterized protein n=1 Tax=Aduncisulcus paluster TaxID=2918883 RepID=A0ABQ5K0D2_9EUKA|nr:hypothetical protein ADUPG1_012062 [Aduncisulcus paluster]